MLVHKFGLLLNLKCAPFVGNTIIHGQQRKLLEKIPQWRILQSRIFFNGEERRLFFKGEYNNGN